MNESENLWAPEDIEGLNDDTDGSWGDYPIDTVLIRHENRTVFDVIRRVEKGAFVMNPDFQRDFIWTVEKQSKLIESILMRIPLPVFYLAEDQQGRMIVVDGLQRLSTFRSYLDNELVLRLPEQKELDGKRFKDLSPKLQNRIEDCNLILYVIDAKVPERARLDIFERVNAGVPLSRQQMRNCLYMGLGTKFVRDEAQTPLFIKATGRSLRTSTMRDREFVNRFCAFQLVPIEIYRGDMDDFLASALERMNSMTDIELANLSNDFRTSLRNNYKVFEKHAFRKHTNAQSGRSVINASLWDVMITGLSGYSEQVIEAKASELREEFFRLMADEEFVRSITYGVNDYRRVRERFTIANEALNGVLYV